MDAGSAFGSYYSVTLPHRSIPMGQRRAVGIAVLCMLVASAALASGQDCPSGSSSISDDGVGNDASKPELQAGSDTTCSGYLAELAVGTAYEKAAGTTTVVAFASSCSEAPDTADVTLSLAYDSGFESNVLAAPSGGWSTLSGTQDSGFITSIQGLGTRKGADCQIESRLCDASSVG